MRMLQHSGSRGRPDILLHVYLSCFRSALSTVDPVASLRRYYMFTCHASDQRRSYATLLHERDMCLLPHCRYCGYPDILLHAYLPRVSSAEIACNVTGCQRDTQEIPHSRSRGKSEVLLRVYLTCFSDQRRSRGKIQKIGVLWGPQTLGSLGPRIFEFCHGISTDLKNMSNVHDFQFFTDLQVCWAKLWSVSACTFDMFQISGDPVAKFMDTLPADSKTTAMEVYIYMHVFSHTCMYTGILNETLYLLLKELLKE